MSDGPKYPDPFIMAVSKWVVVAFCGALVIVCLAVAAVAAIWAWNYVADNSPFVVIRHRADTNAAPVLQRLKED